MIRFLSRIVGMLLLAVALVFAVGDIARSLTDDGVVLTTVADAIQRFAAAASDLGPEPQPAAVPIETTPAGAAPPAFPTDQWWSPILTVPAAIAFGVAALIFLFVGRPRRRPRDRLVR